MNAPASSDRDVVKVQRRAATPIAGAIAGILFAVLFGVSVTIMNDTMADSRRTRAPGSRADSGQFKFALGLIPFAGLFFLWFIAVARERLGRFEDQFFATVFLGSGLLFLAMVFAAAASAGAIVGGLRQVARDVRRQQHVPVRPQVVAQIFAVYALRMAAVFLISQATLWMRTGVMPKMDGAGHLRGRARSALRLHAVCSGHPHLPGVGVPGQRVHPGDASRGRARREGRHPDRPTRLVVLLPVTRSFPRSHASASRLVWSTTSVTERGRRHE